VVTSTPAAGLNCAGQSSGSRTRFGRTRRYTICGIFRWVGRGLPATYLPEAQKERDALPSKERVALYNAVTKLEAVGPALGYPNTSAVQGTNHLRELRPRAERSPWRGLYRLVGEIFVIAAVAPEAQHDPKGFKRACAAAERRLNELEE